MEAQTIYSVMIAIISVIGSSAAWRYFENRAKEREKDDDFIKVDCQKRIEKLEKLLAAATLEKGELRKQILELTKLVAELTVKVEFLEHEKKTHKRINKSHE